MRSSLAPHPWHCANSCTVPGGTTGSVAGAGVRRMLVNHEVGHLLGQHHPAVQCPKAGEPAPVMAQQSSELNGCRPNPWPLPWEVACAARHEEPLAPGYEDHRGSACGP